MCIQYIYTVHRYTVSVKVMLLHMVIVKVRVNVKVCQSLCSAVHLFTLLPPTEELNSLMTRGKKEFFSLFVRLFGRSSLALNRLLWLLMTVCRGWLALFRMPRSLLRVLLSATVTRGSSFMPTTDPAHFPSSSDLESSAFDVLPPQHTTA